MFATTTTSVIDDLENIRLEYSPYRHSSPFDEQRKYPRTCYQQKIPVLLRVRNETGEIFHPTAFLVNESFKGLALVVMTGTPLSRNQLCEVNFFHAEWIGGRIVWSQFIEDYVQEIGITYRF